MSHTSESSQRNQLLGHPNQFLQRKLEPALVEVCTDTCVPKLCRHEIDRWASAILAIRARGRLRSGPRSRTDWRGFALRRVAHTSDKPNTRYQHHHLTGTISSERFPVSSLQRPSRSADRSAGRSAGRVCSTRHVNTLSFARAV